MLQNTFNNSQEFEVMLPCLYEPQQAFGGMPSIIQSLDSESRQAVENHLLSPVFLPDTECGDLAL